MKILITGFEPFSDIKINPSETLVNDLFELLRKQTHLEVNKLILPVDYKKVDPILNAIEFSKYDFIFQFGVAVKRTRVCLERVALNWIESSIPDNSGAHWNCRPIDASLDSAKINSLDLQKIAVMLNSEFPESVEVSLSAGAYLCNFVYFKTLAATSRCLFVHIPTAIRSEIHDWDHTTDAYRAILKNMSSRIIESII